VTSPRAKEFDPVNEDGTLDRVKLARLVLNIAKSFMYFVLNFCYIEHKDMSGEATGSIRFDLWPAQRPVTRLFLVNRLLAILKARQLGLTWLTAAYCLWRCITRQGFLAVVISAKEEWAIEFLDRVRFMYNRLPEWLQPELAKDGSQQMRFVFQWDKEGKKPLVYSDLKSLTTTEEGAQSKTPDLLVLDETARNRYVKSIYASSKPGIDKAGGQIIVISNAHKKGPGWPWTRDLCAAAKKGENSFYFLFMPWWDCPERVTEGERDAMMQDRNYRPTVFKQRLIDDGEDPKDVSENYPDTAEEALATSAGSYFGDTLLRHSQYASPGVTGTLYRKRDKSLYFEEYTKGFGSEHGPNIITLWRYPYWLNARWGGNYWADRYVMGADVSEGQGKSYSVAYVLDRQYDEFVARVRGNRVDAVDFAKYIWLMSLYFCNFTVTGGGTSLGRVPALVCVEKTGAGITTVKELSKVDANQYIRQLVDKRGDGTTDDIGWHESEQAKHLLCADLKQWFKTCRGHVYCQVLLDEASTTIEDENRRINPEKGKMWDTVVAAGCSVQASYQVGGPPSIVKPDPNAAIRTSGSNWGL
jgi:hypothetical protein